jgi:hypothetical protein
MSFNNKFNNLFPRLINEANNSNINIKLAATMLKGKQPIGRICSNTERSQCRGHNCGSLHAEARTLIDYYGKSLVWTSRQGWYFKPPKQKPNCKEK